MICATVSVVVWVIWFIIYFYSRLIYGPMESNRHLTAKVLGPRQNPEKTVNKRVEGLPKQLVKGNRKVSNRGGKAKVDQEIINHIITRLVKCSPYPPMYDSLPVRTVRRRWQSREDSAITGQTFRLTEGHRQFLVCTVADTTAVCWVDCWRIKSISIWVNNSDQDPTTCSIYPLTGDIDSNSFNDREAAFTCSSRSQAKPGSMKIIPARDTPLGSWHKTSSVNATGTLFSMSVDNGGANSGSWSTTTMDIEFEYVENLIGSPQGYSVSISATAPVGSIGGSDIFFPAGQSSMLVMGINRFI